MNPKKTKARFGHLLQLLACKQRGPILVSALPKFVTYILRPLPTYLQPQEPHWAPYTQNFAYNLCVTSVSRENVVIGEQKTYSINVQQQRCDIT